MKLPTVKRILREDVKEAPEWINGIIGPVNAFFDGVYLTLNKNIDELNLASQIKELTVETPSTYPVMPAIKFQSTLNVRATGLTIMQCLDKATYAGVATGNPAWVVNNGVVEISEITGLAPSKTYIVRVRLT